MIVMLNGLSFAVIEMATRGSPSRLDGPCASRDRSKATWPRSSPIHTVDAVRGAFREHGTDVGVVKAFPRARTASGSWVTVLSSG